LTNEKPIKWSSFPVLLAFALFSLAARAAETEPVTFRSHGISLSGDVVFPSDSPPVAGLVLIHGSGKVERMLDIANALAYDGFAVLTYDKRGVGQSGGAYEGQDNVSAANLNLLADDAAAAIKALAKNPRLRKVPLGFLGISQAGWIAPIAATKSRDAQFIALWSGPVCTVSEQLRFQNWASEDATFWDTHTQSQVADYMKAVTYRPDDVDPRKTLSKLHIPAVWAFGGRDTNVPVDLSVIRLEGLIRAGHSDFEYRVFPDVGHDLSGPPNQPRFRYVVDWIKATASRIRGVQ
jgi:pimeloyl-ACP methyl ester carboxylesterase